MLGESLKILHIGKYYHPFSGGMESVVKDLCEGLHLKGHDVTVLCSSTSLKGSEETINGVKVVRLPRVGVLFGQNLNPTILKKVHELAKEADLVHVHCPNPLAEMVSLTLPGDIPVVATYHSDVVRQKFLLKLYRRFFKGFLNRTQKIFVPTKNHIKFSQFLPDYQEKCEIIPFGIKEAPFTSNENNLTCARKYRKKFGAYALFVGRLVEYKGVEVLLEAAKSCSQHIVIVGDGPLKGALNQKIKELKLDDKVSLLGKVKDQDEFVGLYHGCDMLVLPSITPNENFGIVQLEAMACSKPVVTTNLKSGVPAVGEKGKTCLIVEPGNSLQLANAMTMIFNNQELKYKLGRAGRARFEDHYTCKGMIDSQVSAYKRVKEFSTIISKHGKKAA